MCYNEPDFLPIWLRYYTGQVGRECLYVIDHGSNDGSTDGIPGANVIRLQSSPLDEELRCQFVAKVCNGLLNLYDAVLYTDVDEILVADPAKYTSLVDLAKNTPYDVTTVFGLHLYHHHLTEGALTEGQPILEQRHWALPVGSMCKPLLIKRPVRWAPGFHHADAPSVFGDIFMFHLAYFDMDIVRRRQLKRNSVTRVEGHSPHHGEGDAFVQHIESWAHMFPLINDVSLSADCRYKIEFTARMMNEGDNPALVHSPVSGGALWRIPERFIGTF